MHPHNHLFPGFYYLAQAFDYLRQNEDSEDSIILTESAIYQQLPSAPMPHDLGTPQENNADTNLPSA